MTRLSRNPETDSTRQPRGLYRSRRGILFGVCRGLADYFDLSANALRAVAVLLFLLTGFFPVVVAYLAAAFILRPEPALPFRDTADREFYDSFARSPELARERLRRRYENIDRRIRRMESIVTSREFQWEREMKG